MSMCDWERTSKLTYPLMNREIDENLKHTDLKPIVMKINEIDIEFKMSIRRNWHSDEDDWFNECDYWLVTPEVERIKEFYYE